MIRGNPATARPSMGHSPARPATPHARATADRLPKPSQAVATCSAPQAADLAPQAADLAALLDAVAKIIAPVWPLQDYVAVNPYGGFQEHPFHETPGRLRVISECQMLMPRDYYRKRFQRGKFGMPELRAAVEELVADRIPGAEQLSAQEIALKLNAPRESALSSGASPGAGAGSGEASDRRAGWRPFTRVVDQQQATAWTELVEEEVSKTCAAHYDRGQALWASPYRDLPLFAAWRAAAARDRRLELLGLSGLRQFVAGLPQDATGAISQLLARTGLPAEHWAAYLQSLALSLPGWSAWAKFNALQAAKQAGDSTDPHRDFTALLAIRLAYDVAVAEQAGLDGAQLTAVAVPSTDRAAGDLSAADLEQLVLLRANEIAFRERLVGGITATVRAQAAGDDGEGPAVTTVPKLAQLVFCIDVRSERIRRHLEATDGGIETFGFAGFFGLPFEYVRLGESAATQQFPVLIDSQFQVFEDVAAGADARAQATRRRKQLRSFRGAWLRFQKSAVSCFSFVETLGLTYAVKFAARLLGCAPPDSRFDGLPHGVRGRLGPSLGELDRQGVTASRQADYAEGILRGVGITRDFAPLVVFCGHGSQTENNPLQAGLDCGACAGHSGEANARLAAQLLNQPAVRQLLAERGIAIPAETHFVAGLHNTTTDGIEFFDLETLPESHQFPLRTLRSRTLLAGEMTRAERLHSLPGKDEATLIRRSRDWSEVRPEWGLSGNAAFIVGRREITKPLAMNGECFLHSYDHRHDPAGRLLEQIMTAPLIVANWINMQYYASTVDQRHFGAGNKAIHNVVGKFGIQAGNGGDLQTGLPWQSLHDGENYQHDPVRLLAVIEAPRAAIERVLDAHENVRQLAANGWIQLVALESQRAYRYTALGRWEQLPSELSLAAAEPASISRSSRRGTSSQDPTKSLI